MMQDADIDKTVAAILPRIEAKLTDENRALKEENDEVNARRDWCEERMIKCFQERSSLRTRVAELEDALRALVAIADNEDGTWTDMEDVLDNGARDLAGGE